MDKICRRTSNDELVLCIKISQEEWIKKLCKGNAWFSKVNVFIEKAMETNNNEQGDLYEGIFARCSKESSLISQMKVLLKDDLEIIDCDDYALLRRRSAKQLNIFCCYGIRKSELNLIGDAIADGNKLKSKFEYYIDSKMYDGFLQDGTLPKNIYGYYCSAGYLNERLEEKLNDKKLIWKRKMIEYDIDFSKDFFIPPTDEYEELFHKRIDLEYQHESRFLIYNHLDSKSGFEISFEPISTHSGAMAVGELYVEGTAFVEELKESE